MLLWGVGWKHHADSGRVDRNAHDPDQARIGGLIGRHSDSGTAAIEFALMTPFLLILIGGVTEIGFAMYEAMQVNAAVEAGVLYAAANGYSTSISGAVTDASRLPSAYTLTPVTPVISEFCGCPVATASTASVTNFWLPPCSAAGYAALRTGGAGTYVSVKASLHHLGILPTPPAILQLVLGLGDRSDQDQLGYDPRAPFAKVIRDGGDGGDRIRLGPPLHAAIHFRNYGYWPAALDLHNPDAGHGSGRPLRGDQPCELLHEHPSLPREPGLPGLTGITFTPSTQSCGEQVVGTYPFQFLVPQFGSTAPFGSSSLTLSATACYPIQP